MWHFANCWVCFEVEKSMHYFRQIKWGESAFKRRNNTNGYEITLRSRQNRRKILFCELLGLPRRCRKHTLHSASNDVKRALNRRNIPNRNEITLSFGQNRRIIAFCELLALFRRWRRRALLSVCSVERKQRLNVKISQTGTKWNIVSVKIDERMYFASCWACFDAESGIPYILRVKWCEKSA